MKTALPLLSLLLLIGACKTKIIDSPMNPEPLTLTSSSFAVGDSIPKKYSCLGTNNHPQLSWKGGKTGIKSYVLIMEDPDAKAVVGYTWMHWVLYNIPSSQKSITESNSKIASIGTGVHGTTSFNDTLYGGPCPPPSQTHNYHFKLYALDIAQLTVAKNATAAEVYKGMAGHAIDSVSLKGTFKK